MQYQTIKIQFNLDKILNYLKMTKSLILDFKMKYKIKFKKSLFKTNLLIRKKMY
jgi:hypothetical protein